MDMNGSRDTRYHLSSASSRREISLPQDVPATRYTHASNTAAAHLASGMSELGAMGHGFSADKNMISQSKLGVPYFQTKPIQQSICKRAFTLW